MSLVKIQGNASGTGEFTIAAPNSNTNRTLTLPDATGTVVVTGGAQTIEFAAGSSSAPSITTTGDTNTGIFFPAADTIAFAEGGTEVMRINSSGDVGIGTSSPAAELDVVRSFDGSTVEILVANTFYAASSTDESVAFQGEFYQNDVAARRGAGYIQFTKAGDFSNNANASANMIFGTRNAGTLAERARITSGGSFVLGKTTTSFGTAGSVLAPEGYGLFTVNADITLYVNRLANDGVLVSFNQAGVEEGTISVSGSTVSYNGGHLSRWAQMLTKPDLLKGTVMSNLDEMNVYIAPTTYWMEEDELPEGVNVGDVKVETHEVENEQLNKVKVSDVEGDPNVAGVFVNWTYDEAHQVDEINMAMTGDMIIRIAQGVVVQKGDLLMSAGDGTAKPQGDDIVRSKTVAKVTSNHVTCTYKDGSYCVPCVLMAC